MQIMVFDPSEMIAGQHEYYAAVEVYRVQGDYGPQDATHIVGVYPTEAEAKTVACRPRMIVERVRPVYRDGKHWGWTNLRPGEVFHG